MGSIGKKKLPLLDTIENAYLIYFRWRAKPLTREHKPESEMELARIEAAGGNYTIKIVAYINITSCV